MFVFDIAKMAKMSIPAVLVFILKYVSRKAFWRQQETVNVHIKHNEKLIQKLAQLTKEDL